MSFTSLPPEIILQISTYLPPSFLPTLAHLTSLTYQTLHTPLLTHLTTLHNKNTLIHRFGPPTRRPSQCIRGPAIYIPSHPQLIAINYNPPLESQLADLSYLKLNGDLHWLLPLDETSAEENEWHVGTALSPSQIAELETLAVKIGGIKFPASFLTFMGSQELIGRMWLGGDYFKLSALKKCRAEDDGGKGGYMIRFLSDQQGCRYWSLYMDREGRSCVMNSQGDVNCDSCKWRVERMVWMGVTAPGEELGGRQHAILEVEKETGVLANCERMDWTLGHWSWEEWMCMRYFDGWNAACLSRGREVGERQIEFLDAFWGRKEEGV